LVVLLGFAAAAVAGLAWNSTTESSTDWRIVTALSQAPIGDGRLFRALDIPPDPGGYEAAVGDGALQILTNADSPLHLRIRALIEAGQGNLSAAAETLH